MLRPLDSIFHPLVMFFRIIYFWVPWAFIIMTAIFQDFRNFSPAALTSGWASSRVCKIKRISEFFCKILKIQIYADFMYFARHIMKRSFFPVIKLCNFVHIQLSLFTVILLNSTIYFDDDEGQFSSCEIVIILISTCSFTTIDFHWRHHVKS